MIENICFAVCSIIMFIFIGKLQNMETDHLYHRLIREAHKKGAKIVLIQVNLYMTDKHI
jgi:hypothetical protein